MSVLYQVSSAKASMDYSSHLAGYTKQARDFAATKNNLRLVDGSGLVEMILRHYEQFDARYKGMIPLKQVYVPDPPGEDTEQEN